MRNEDKLYSIMAKWYDELYPDDEDTKYSLKLLDQIFKKNKVKKVLDIACGSGRHLIPLAKKGYSVDGFDYSKTFVKMLKEKIKKEKIKSKIWFADMANFKTKKKYDAILNMFTSFSYMYSPELQIKAFKCFNKALKKGGILIIDTQNGWNLIASKRMLPYVKDVDKSGKKKLINENYLKPDFRYQKMDLKSIYAAYEGKKKVAGATSNLQIAMLSVDSFEFLSEIAGFKMIGVYGDYKGKKIESYKKTDKIGRLIYVGKKVS